jgi:hypothetical protein
VLIYFIGISRYLSYSYDYLIGVSWIGGSYSKATKKAGRKNLPANRLSSDGEK